MGVWRRGVQQDQCDHTQVPNQSEEVDEHEHQKERDLQLWVISYPGKSELSHACAVLRGDLFVQYEWPIAVRKERLVSA